MWEINTWKHLNSGWEIVNWPVRYTLTQKIWKKLLDIASGFNKAFWEESIISNLSKDDEENPTGRHNLETLDKSISTLEELEYLLKNFKVDTATYDSVLILWDELVKMWKRICLRNPENKNHLQFDKQDDSNSDTSILSLLKDFFDHEKMLEQSKKELKNIIKLLIESKLDISWKELIKYWRKIHSLWVYFPQVW